MYLLHLTTQKNGQLNKSVYADVDPAMASVIVMLAFRRAKEKVEKLLRIEIEQSPAKSSRA